VVSSILASGKYLLDRKMLLLLEYWALFLFLDKKKFYREKVKKIEYLL